MATDPDMAQTIAQLLARIEELGHGLRELARHVEHDPIGLVISSGDRG